MEAAMEGISVIEEWINWTPSAVYPSKGTPELSWRPYPNRTNDTGPVLCLLCPENQLRATGGASAALLCSSSPALVWTGTGASLLPALSVAKTNPNNWSERFALAPILFTNHGASGFPKLTFFCLRHFRGVSGFPWFTVCVYIHTEKAMKHPCSSHRWGSRLPLRCCHTLKSSNAGNAWDFSTTPQEGLGPSCSIKLLSTVLINNWPVMLRGKRHALADFDVLREAGAEYTKSF